MEKVDIKKRHSNLIDSYNRLKNKYERLRFEFETQKTALRRKRSNLARVSGRHRFLKSRVEEVYGRRAFMDLVNHVNNPDHTEIITGDDYLKTRSNKCN